MTQKWKTIDRSKKIILCVLLAVIIFAVGGAAKVLATGESADSQSQADTAESELTKEQEEALEKIRATYNTENQQEVKTKLETQKAAQEYTAEDMLIEYNPFGTNTQSLYVYFNTEEAVKVTYTVHVSDDSIKDFTLEAQSGQYLTSHEFQVIGLIPDAANTVTFTMADEAGNVTAKKEYTYQMGSLLGTEEVQLETTIESDTDQLEDGLYVVMGNDSTKLDFMYYYDNQGVIRGEVPLIGYRSHRLIYDDDSMYYSISETKMAQVDRLGQVTNVFDLGQYELHHDYVFDNDGNILILASDTEQDSIEDIIVKLDVSSGEVTEVLDLEDLFGDYKATCQKNSDGELDWMHINTLQWTGDGAVILSSRETSTIMKINNLYFDPSVSYMIGSEEFWDGTGYEDLLYEKDGDFTVQGGQHSVTYAEDDSLAEGQYYLYMYNNNSGVSQSQPDFDWSSAGLTETSAKDGQYSYYYKYLVDEKTGTFELTDSFAVPYSGYVSSAQEIGDNIVTDSGFQGIFQEYNENHELIASFKMNAEKFIYRVYKVGTGYF